MGGEFPIPVLQGGANSGAVTIQFREFGVRLKFTPMITSKQHHPSSRQAGSFGPGLHQRSVLQRLHHPGAVDRKMETNVELGEGQSFVIAGLIDNQVTETISKIPGLANLPILGNLFRARSITKSTTNWSSW